MEIWARGEIFLKASGIVRRTDDLGRVGARRIYPKRTPGMAENTVRVILQLNWKLAQLPVKDG